MNKIHANTIKIISVASGICDSKVDVPLEQLLTIMAFAKEHTVDGIVAEAVLERKVNITNADDATDERATISMKLVDVQNKKKKTKVKYDSALEDLNSVLQREKVDFVVLKGAAVASFYSNPSSRTMGDIDFYVPKWDYERASATIEKGLNVNIERCNVDKHDSFSYKGMRFEMHYQIETFGNSGHQRYFNDLVDKSIVDKKIRYFNIGSGVKVPMLEPKIDLIVVFKHMFNHLIGDGIGLRHCTDIAVLLRAYMNEINIQEIRMHLNKIGYLKAFDAMVALAGRYYNIRWDEYKPFLKSKDFRIGDNLMYDILKNGNFGRLDYKYSWGWRKQVETTKRFFSNIIKYFNLAPWDLICFIPRRINISLRRTEF